MLVLQVSGMACDGCADAIRRAVGVADPSAAVKIDLETGRISVDTDAQADSGRRAIEMKGYLVERVSA